MKRVECIEGMVTLKLGKVYDVLETSETNYRIKGERGTRWYTKDKFKDVVEIPPHANEPFNAKIICVKEFSDYSTVDKVYNVKNGHFQWDTGTWTSKLKSLDDINKNCLSKFELYTEPAPKKEVVKYICKESYVAGEWLTEGEIYEVVDNIITFDDGYKCIFFHEDHDEHGKIGCKEFDHYLELHTEELTAFELETDILYYEVNTGHIMVVRDNGKLYRRNGKVDEAVNPPLRYLQKWRFKRDCSEEIKELEGKIASNKKELELINKQKKGYENLIALYEEEIEELKM